MDEIIGNAFKFLSSTILVRILSYPAFSIEIFLAITVCVVHCLLIFEVNTSVKRTSAKAVAKMRMKHSIKGISYLESEPCSFHSLVTLQTTRVFQKNPEQFSKAQIYAPVAAKIQKRYSRSDIGGWSLARGDSIFRHRYSDRIEHLLSITPSEYVRRDKERKSKEQGLRSCIQSLTSLLEKALNNDTLEIQNMSKDDIKKSINTLRENFQSQLNTNYQLTDFPSPSLQSLIELNEDKKILKNSLSPDLISSIYRTSNVSFSKNNYDSARNRRKSEDSLSVRSSKSLSELFRKQSEEFYNLEEKRAIMVNC